MRQEDGSPMTGSIGGKLWLVRTSIGLSPIPGSTMKPLPVEHGPSQDAIFAYRTATQGSIAPQNPDRSWYGWVPTPPAWPARPSPVPPAVPSSEICRRFNQGRCRQTRCRYVHACKECGAQHPWVSCPRNVAQPQQRPRSPIRQPNPAFAQAKWPVAQHPWFDLIIQTNNRQCTHNCTNHG